MVAFVFPLWTFAIIAGAIWAELPGEDIGAGIQKRPGPLLPGFFMRLTCMPA